MNCPACQHEMKPGRVSVHGTLGGFLLAGYSLQDCWFEAYERDAGEQTVIESGGERSGYRCPQCHTVVILSSSRHKDRMPPYLEAGDQPRL